MSTPRVSVVMPLYNTDEYIGESIRSILEQTYTDFELIVIDDGSTDDSLAQVSRFNDTRIRVTKNAKNHGLPFTRNRCLEIAQGEYVAVLDSDDLALPERLAKQVTFLDAHPDIVLVGSAAEYIDKNGTACFIQKVQTNPLQIHQILFTSNCFIHSSVMFRRMAVASLGGYSMLMPYAQDYDLWLRLSAAYRLANMPDTLTKYRVHPGQVTTKKLKQQRKFADIARIAAYKQQLSANLLPSATVAPNSSLISRLIGRTSTLGNDYLHLINQYKILNHDKMAAKLILPALLEAPICPGLWKVAIQHIGQTALVLYLKRTSRWYAHKLSLLFKN